MQLPPGLRSLIAWFDAAERARRAASEMTRLGLTEVRVDRVHQHPGHETSRPFQPLSGRIESLSALTLGIDPHDADRSAALAADPSASGLAGSSGARWEAYCLTAVVPEARVGEAEAILRRFGGRL